jgi:hypothetical protein
VIVLCAAGSSWSNHSWGVAVDFYFGTSIDPRGDGKTQYGLLLIAPFFAKEKLYWAAGVDPVFVSCLLCFQHTHPLFVP